jgi:hypothetical protein
MWGWLESDREHYTWGFVLRVIVKAAVLFALCNLIYALVNPMMWLGRVSLYGTVYPYRDRLPFGENPAEAYSLTVDSLDAMFASHVVARPKAPDEYRVLLVGDSATWGWFLEADETYAAQINAASVSLDDGRRVIAYNIGYPVLNATKDLILLDYARRYDPDMVIWLLTAQSLRYEDGNGNSVQAGPPVSQWDRRYIDPLIDTYDLALELPNEQPALWERTIIGERHELANLLRLQVYGAAWGATGIDQAIPDEFELRRTDLSDNGAWANFDGPTDLTLNDLAFDVLTAGVDLMGDVPVIVINQPNFISDGENSDVRYNSFYPRWAYDDYRTLVVDLANESGFTYLDWWDVLPSDAFTDSPVHVTPAASAIVSERLVALILETTATETR